MQQLTCNDADSPTTSGIGSGRRSSHNWDSNSACGRLASTENNTLCELDTALPTDVCKIDASASTVANGLAWEDVLYKTVGELFRICWFPLFAAALWRASTNEWDFDSAC